MCSAPSGDPAASGGSPRAAPSGHRRERTTMTDDQSANTEPISQGAAPQEPVTQPVPETQPVQAAQPAAPAQPGPAGAEDVRRKWVIGGAAAAGAALLLVGFGLGYITGDQTGGDGGGRSHSRDFPGMNGDGGGPGRGGPQGGAGTCRTVRDREAATGRCPTAGTGSSPAATSRPRTAPSRPRTAPGRPRVRRPGPASPGSGRLYRPPLPGEDSGFGGALDLAECFADPRGEFGLEVGVAAEDLVHQH